MKLSKKINYKKSKSKSKIKRNLFGKSKSKRKGTRKTLYKTKKGGSFNTRQCDSQVIVDKEQLILIGDEYNSSEPATNLNNNRFRQNTKGKSGYFYVLEEFKIGKNIFKQGTVIHLKEGVFVTISEDNLEAPLEIEIPYELFEKLRHVKEPSFRIRCGGEQGKYLSLDQLAKSIEEILYNSVNEHSDASPVDLEETPEMEKEEISQIFEKVFRELNKLSGLSTTNLIEVECIKLIRSRRDELFKVSDELMVEERKKSAINNSNLNEPRLEPEEEEEQSNPVINGFIKAVLANETYKLPNSNHLELSVKEKAKLFVGGSSVQQIIYNQHVFESVRNMMKDVGGGGAGEAKFEAVGAVVVLGVILLVVGFFSICTTVIGKIKSYRREKKINKWICSNLLPRITTTKTPEQLIEELEKLNFNGYSEKFMKLLVPVRQLIMLKISEVYEEEDEYNIKDTKLWGKAKNSSVETLIIDEMYSDFRKLVVQFMFKELSGDEEYDKFKTLMNQVVDMLITNERLSFEELIKNSIYENKYFEKLIKNPIYNKKELKELEEFKKYIETLKRVIRYLIHVEMYTIDKNNYNTYFTNLIKTYLVTEQKYKGSFKFVLFGIRRYSGKEQKFKKIEGFFEKKIIFHLQTNNLGLKHRIFE